MVLIFFRVLTLGPFKYYVTPKEGREGMVKSYDVLHRGEGGYSHMLHNTRLI